MTVLTVLISVSHDIKPVFHPCQINVSTNDKIDENYEGCEWGNDIPQDIIVKIIKLIQMVLASFKLWSISKMEGLCCAHNYDIYTLRLSDSLSDDVLWISHKFHLHQTINSVMWSTISFIFSINWFSSSHACKSGV